MDTITTFAKSISFPGLLEFDKFIDSSIIYLAILIVLIIVGESRNEKRLKLFLAIIFAFLAATLLKNFFIHERPCTDESWCPEGYSFPSSHATLAFALMAGFLNKKSFIWYLLFALLIGFSRMNFGVHIFLDIAGALPVGLLSYYIIDLIWPKIDLFLKPKIDNSS